MKNKTTKIVIAGAVLLVLCGVIGTCVAGKPSDTANPPMSTIDPNAVFTQVAGTIIAELTEVTQPTEIPTPENTATPLPVLIIAPLYNGIRDSVSSMTEIQWKAYLPTLIGMKADNWTGWVVDVDKGIGGDYKVWIDMDDPSATLSTQDVYLYGITPEEAAGINKNATITFSGIITSTSELFGHVSINMDKIAYQMN